MKTNKTVRAASKTAHKPVSIISNAVTAPSSYWASSPKEAEIALNAYIADKGTCRSSKYGSWTGPNKKVIDDAFRKIFTARGKDLKKVEVYSACYRNFIVWLSVQAKRKMAGTDKKSKTVTSNSSAKEFLTIVPDGYGVIIARNKGNTDRYTAVAVQKDSVILRYVHANDKNDYAMGTIYKFQSGVSTNNCRNASYRKIVQALDLLKTLPKQPLPLVSATPTTPVVKPTIAPQLTQIIRLSKPALPKEDFREVDYKVSLNLLRKSFEKDPYRIDSEIRKFITANPEVPKAAVEQFISQ